MQVLNNYEDVSNHMYWLVTKSLLNLELCGDVFGDPKNLTSCQHLARIQLLTPLAAESKLTSAGLEEELERMMNDKTVLYIPCAILENIVLINAGQTLCEENIKFCRRHLEAFEVLDR